MSKSAVNLQPAFLYISAHPSQYSALRLDQGYRLVGAVGHSHTLLSNQPTVCTCTCCNSPSKKNENKVSSSSSVCRRVQQYVNCCKWPQQAWAGTSPCHAMPLLWLCPHFFKQGLARQQEGFYFAVLEPSYSVAFREQRNFPPMQQSNQMQTKRYYFLPSSCGSVCVRSVYLCVRIPSSDHGEMYPICCLAVTHLQQKMSLKLSNNVTFCALRRKRGENGQRQTTARFTRFGLALGGRNSSKTPAFQALQIQRFRDRESAASGQA